MPDFPTLVVAGLGRCGLTMTCKMLDAGGASVAGTPPAYEPDPESITWETDAVKMVDPIGNELSDLFPPPGRCRWVWMLRDPKEQARSMAQMLSATGRDVHYRRLMKTIRPGTRQHMRWLSRRGEPVSKFRCGDALASPLEFAQQIKEVSGLPLDTDAMCEVIDDRPPEHSGDLSKELRQIPDD